MEIYLHAQSRLAPIGKVANKVTNPRLPEQDCADIAAVRMWCAGAFVHVDGNSHASIAQAVYVVPAGEAVKPLPAICTREAARAKASPPGMVALHIEMSPAPVQVDCDSNRDGGSADEQAASAHTVRSTPASAGGSSLARAPRASFTNTHDPTNQAKQKD